MSAVPKPYYTPAEYLAIERASEFRHEYYCGEMFQMAGATFPHVRILNNISQSRARKGPEKDNKTPDPYGQWLAGWLDSG